MRNETTPEDDAAYNEWQAFRGRKAVQEAEASLQQVEAQLSQARADAANRLSSELNAHISLMPQQTLHDRQVLLKLIVLVCNRFDLAVACPNTGLPAKLYVERQDEAHSRFRFRISLGEQQRQTTAASVSLSQLRLTVPRTWRDEAVAKSGFDATKGMTR